MKRHHILLSCFVDGVGASPILSETGFSITMGLEASAVAVIRGESTFYGRRLRVWGGYTNCLTFHSFKECCFFCRDQSLTFFLYDEVLLTLWVGEPIHFPRYPLYREPDTYLSYRLIVVFDWIKDFYSRAGFCITCGRGDAIRSPTSMYL